MRKDMNFGLDMMEMINEFENEMQRNPLQKRVWLARQNRNSNKVIKDGIPEWFRNFFFQIHCYAEQRMQ